MQVKKYFEKKVSLLSTSDVRYDGELYTVDPSEQSIALKHVNCMGTEGRRSGDQAIAPSDCTYEFIIFRAVNIRELWLLDDDNRKKRDLTQEILEPLRSGQSGNYSSNKRSDNFDNTDSSGPKRKVGYQSRSAQQQNSGNQGYDPYYQQAAPSYNDYGGGYQGYNQRGPGPAPYGDESSYPPLPNQQSGGYYQQPQGNGYYDGYYGPPQRRYHRQGGYQQQYARQRAPQYYNQQRAPQYYNNHGGGQYNGYYQQRRYPSQYNRGYYQQGGYNQNNRGNRGYNNQRNRRPQQPRNQQSGTSQAGTGAFLDNRRLRGDEIDIKDQQDFDFGAAKNEFDLNKEDQQNGGSQPLPAATSPTDDPAVSAVKEEVVTASKEEVVPEDDKGDQEETKAADDEDDSKKYDAAKSFFDGLMTETKKSKPKQDMQTQKDTDTKTFGSVAATYKSRHINMQQRGRNNYQQNRGYRQNNRGYQQNRNYQNYNNYNRQQQQQSNYTTNKWVVRR